MPVNSLERVMWRIRSGMSKDEREAKRVHLYALKAAIVKEIGYSQQTYRRIRQVLIVLGWIKFKKNYVFLTDKDLVDA